MTAEEARAALTPQQVDGKSMDQLFDQYNQRIWMNISKYFV